MQVVDGEWRRERPFDVFLSCSRPDNGCQLGGCRGGAGVVAAAGGGGCVGGAAAALGRKGVRRVTERK